MQTAQHHGGGWVVFLIHDICPAYCTYGITSTQLTQVLSWIHGQRDSGLKVETVHQVIGGAVKPAVAGPAPAPIGGTGVANADLAAAAGSYPARFQPAHYGDNRASFSYQPSGGPGGSATETVSLTGAQSGDAKLLQETDLGSARRRSRPAAVMPSGPGTDRRRRRSLICTTGIRSGSGPTGSPASASRPQRRGNTYRGRPRLHRPVRPRSASAWPSVRSGRSLRPATVWPRLPRIT